VSWINCIVADLEQRTGHWDYLTKGLRECSTKASLSQT
jgi:hypothetical protein